MTKTQRRLTGALATIVLGLATMAGAESAPTRVGVRLLNRALVSRAIMTRVTKEVSRVFGRIGIEMTWLEAHDQDPLRVVLILDRAPFQPVTTDPQAMGFAQRVTADGNRIAFAFVDRVQQLAGASELSALLACVIAHEIGHLLLPDDSHSAGGIMQARWDRGAVLLTARGGLAFTRQQGADMRAQIAAATGSAPTR